MTLGEKIRALRLERGLSQKQLAGDCITRNMLSQIEHDQAKPSMRTLEHLARMLAVDPGQLVAQTQQSAEQAALAQARALYRAHDAAGCLSLLSSAEGEEANLLRARCALALAKQALDDERFESARPLAEQALAASAESLYPDAALQITAAQILARCAAALKDGADAAFERYRQTYQQLQTGVEYHLTLARFALEQEHIQAAEREIWSIAELPDAARAEYLILRGRIAAKKEQYENAILYLRQAEEAGPLPKLLRRELLSALERCFRETEQYKQAYTCATALREL